MGNSRWTDLATWLRQSPNWPNSRVVIASNGDRTLSVRVGGVEHRRHVLPREHPARRYRTVHRREVALGA